MPSRTECLGPGRTSFWRQRVQFRLSLQLKVPPMSDEPSFDNCTSFGMRGARMSDSGEGRDRY
jgi:hypothetical protein